jgi:GPH family glycoside/pentoside/hexuronide:cation symporter
MTSQAAQTRKLTIGRKLAFGVGDLGPAIVTAVNGFFLNAFLLDVAGLRPSAAGIIFLLVKIWDSVNDPIIGALTDRTNTRWGRRRPWLLFGAIPFGLAFFLHWLVPDLSQTGKFWYYLFVALLLDIGFTAVNVPYTALTPELTQDYDERTSLNSYRFSFSILGGMLAAFLHGIIVTRFDNVLTGNAVAAAIWAFFIIGSNFITFAYTEEQFFQQERPPQPGFIEGFRIAFSNKAFIYVTLIYLLSWLSIQFVQANLQLYGRYWLQISDEQFTFIILAIQTSAFLFMMIWSPLSAKVGKQKVYYIGVTIWILTELYFYTIQPGQYIQVLIIAIFAGAGVSVGYLIPWSLLPDVIELDELETGQRREGVYYGFFVFLQKLGLSLGLAIANFALEAAGYVNQEIGGPLPTQPDAVLQALRLFVTLIPAAVLLLSIPVVRAYPITREKHAEIKAALAKRQNTGA